MSSGSSESDFQCQETVEAAVAALPMLKADPNNEDNWDALVTCAFHWSETTSALVKEEELVTFMLSLFRRPDVTESTLALLVSVLWNLFQPEGDTVMQLPAVYEEGLMIEYAQYFEAPWTSVELPCFGATVPDGIIGMLMGASMTSNSVRRHLSQEKAFLEAVSRRVDQNFNAALLLAIVAGSEDDSPQELLTLLSSYVKLFTELLVTGPTNGQYLEAPGNLVYEPGQIASGLLCMSRSDALHNHFYAHIDSYVEFLSRDYYSPIRALFLRVLAYVSFNTKNLQHLRETGVAQHITLLTDDSDAEVCSAAMALAFILEEENAGKGQGDKVGQQPQVMISYNWTHQPMIKRLVEQLKRDGIKVWFDMDKMNGSTLGAMADAIDGSVVVLVAVSPEYKESINCRVEAEYAFSSKKPIVPLMMNTQWKANGWLGALIGTKLWYNFSQDSGFQAAYQGLRKELDPYVQMSGGTHQPLASAARAVPQAEKKAALLEQWGHTDVASWATPLFSGEFVSLLARNKLDGPALLLLSQEKSTEFFYLIRHWFGPDSVALGDVLKFKKELQKVCAL